MPSNYTLDYETTDDESSVGTPIHSPPVPTRPNGVSMPERIESEHGEEEEAEIDDAFSIDLNDEEFKVSRTEDNEHLFDIDGNYVGPIERDFESCSDDS